MYNELKDAIEAYRQMDLDNPYTSEEYSYLSIVKEFIQWRELSPEEKHQKRRFIFSVINKTGNAEAFVVETTIIELYEIVEALNLKLSDLAKTDLLTRLTAMLTVFKFHVNEQRDTRKMSTQSFRFIINIANSCVTDVTFIEVKDDLKRMIGLFSRLLELMKSI